MWSISLRNKLSIRSQLAGGEETNLRVFRSTVCYHVQADINVTEEKGLCMDDPANIAFRWDLAACHYFALLADSGYTEHFH